MLVGLLLVVMAGCSRAGGAPQTTHAAVEDSPQTIHLAEAVAAATAGSAAEDPMVASLDRLRKRGEFDAFVEAALAPGNEPADNSALQIIRIEALLAVGRNTQAATAALDAAELARSESDFVAAGQALKLWATARFRLREPLDDARFADLLASLPAEDPALQTLRFWHAALDKRTAYRSNGAAGSEGVELPTVSGAQGSVPDALRAIEARANGVALPMVFIDTGSQHTLITTEAARLAGVTVGEGTTQLVGFAGVTARPGVLDKLELGGLALHDVPVLVGDAAPLSALNGQMSLGIELMHHVRFIIDYPGRRVLAELADTARRGAGLQPAWEIPLWTFSQACLAQGQMVTGKRARILVDTGNRAGTFVSSRWARHNIPRFQRPGSGMVFKFKQLDLTIDAVELGSLSLRDWPVLDTIPHALERLDLVDVLLGHDLLWPYQVTIDLRQRVLLLSGGPTAATGAHRRGNHPRGPARSHASEE
jgi:hypothetical protein